MSQKGSGGRGLDPALPARTSKKMSRKIHCESIESRGPKSSRMSRDWRRKSRARGPRRCHPGPKKCHSFPLWGGSKRCHKRAPGIHLASTLIRGPEIHQRCHSGGYPGPASAVGRFVERCHGPARPRGCRFGVQTEEPQKMSRTAIDARTTKGCLRRSSRSPKVWEGR
jgi:hypothetical protein